LGSRVRGCEQLTEVSDARIEMNSFAPQFERAEQGLRPRHGRGFLLLTSVRAALIALAARDALLSPTQS
jgi:hypothetical protein